MLVSMRLKHGFMDVSLDFSLKVFTLTPVAKANVYVALLQHTVFGLPTFFFPLIFY